MGTIDVKRGEGPLKLAAGEAHPSVRALLRANFAVRADRQVDRPRHDRGEAVDFGRLLAEELGD